MVNKKFVYIGLGVVVVAAVAYFIFKKTNVADNNQTNVTSTDQAAGTTTQKSTAPTAKKPATNVSLPATQKYLDAIRIYKTSGYYFQFVDCHGAPGSLVVKKGKKFMLDNRDAVSRKIAIEGGQSFTIGAYNFAIATAPSTLGLHYITCDGGGAASILVQQ